MAARNSIMQPGFRFRLVNVFIVLILTVHFHHLDAFITTTRTSLLDEPLTSEQHAPRIMCGKNFDSRGKIMSWLEAASNRVRLRFPRLVSTFAPYLHPTGISLRLQKVFEKADWTRWLDEDTTNDDLRMKSNIMKLFAPIQRILPTKSKFNSKITSHSANSTRPVAKNDTILIFVYWHIFTRHGRLSKEEAHGNLSEERILLQIQRLNEYFQDTLFRFALHSITRPQDRDLDDEFERNTYKFGLDDEHAFYRVWASSVLRRGTPLNLNVFSVDYYTEPDHSVTTGMIGYFPRELYGHALKANISRSMLFMKAKDHVFIAHQTVPASPLSFNTPISGGGVDLVHEVGHWLGLRHVFEGQCSFPNDGVTDTRPQKAPTFYDKKSCIVEFTPKISCQNQDMENAHFLNQRSMPTYDTLFNLMDYGDDACLRHFTPGQIKKMKQHWQDYRVKAHQALVQYIT